MPSPNPSRPRINLLAGMAALGLCAGLQQVVLLREILSFTSGNELLLGVGLACWLSWTAAGSFLGSLAGKKEAAAAPALAMALVGLAGPVSLALCRRLPDLLGLNFGQLPSLPASLGYCLLALAPAALAAGLAFPALLRISSRTPGGGAGWLGRLYGLESLGFALAGAAFTFVLVGAWTPPAMLGAAGLLALGAGFLLGGRLRLANLAGAAVLLFILVNPSGPGRVFAPPRPAGLSPAARQETPYARLTAYRGQGQVNFYANGQWLFSRPDRAGLERAALLPLLAKPQAQSVLFLGGGALGLDQEAWKRRPAIKITAVELSPWLVTLAQREAGIKPAPGLKIVFGDGRDYLQRTKQRFDLVVVDQPPPITLRTSRYYSQEGFAALARVLKPGGVAVTHLPGMEQLLGLLQAKQAASVLNAAASSFAQAQLLSGPELYIFLAKQKGRIPGQPGIWLDRLAKSGWQDVSGIRPDLLLGGLDDLRLGFLRQAFTLAGPGLVNRDLKPVALLYDQSLWGTGLGGQAKGLRLLEGLSAAKLMVPVLALAVVLALLGRGGKSGPWLAAQAPRLGVFCIGLVSMSLSVFLLYIYQILFGSVYLGLAGLLAGFMAGCAGAALLAGRLAQKAARPGAWLAGLGLGLSLACLLSWALALTLPGAAPILGKALLMLLAALTGGITGAYFFFAGRLALVRAGNPAGRGGALYALDMTGALLGSLLAPLLAPSVGLGVGLCWLAALNLLPLGILNLGKQA